MSATNKTTYYELPTFIGTDTPSWLGDWNNTMTKLDTAMNNIHTEAQSAQGAANSAQSASDANTEALTSQEQELQTIKKAVQNYDSILNFSLKPFVAVSNNVDANGANMVLSQNTNKTLNKISVWAQFLPSISNFISYNFTDKTQAVVPWVDLGTIEDNAFNLNQSSQPNATTALYIGVGTYLKVSEKEATSRDIRAWFDGTTTHIGMIGYTSDNATNVVGNRIYITAPIFLTGSVYA